MIPEVDNSMVAEHLLCKDVLLFQEPFSSLPFTTSLSILATFQFSHYILILQVLSLSVKNKNH